MLQTRLDFGLTSELRQRRAHVVVRLRLAHRVASRFETLECPLEQRERLVRRAALNLHGAEIERDRRARRRRRPSLNVRQRRRGLLVQRSGALPLLPVRIRGGKVRQPNRWLGELVDALQAQRFVRHRRADHGVDRRAKDRTEIRIDRRQWQRFQDLACGVE